MVNAYILLGWVQDNMARYYDAILSYTEANKLSTKINYISGEASSYMNIGALYNNLGNLQEATTYYHYAADKYKEENDKEGLVYYYNNLGYIKFSEKEYNASLDYYNQGLVIAKEANMIRMESNILINTIFSLIELDSIDKAQSLTSRVYEIDKKNEDVIGLSYLSIAKSKIEIKKGTGPYDFAGINKAYAAGKKVKDLELQKSCTELLSKMYEANGMFKKALSQEKLYGQLVDTISKNVTKIKFKNLELEKERIKQTKNQIIREAELTNAIEKQSFIKRLLVLLLSFVSVLSFVMYNLYQSTKKSKSLIQDKNDQLLKTEIDLEQKNEDLNKYIEHNIELEQFAHIASHDIKSPLRTITSFVGLLKKDLSSRLTQKQEDYFVTIEKGVYRLNLLIEDLLKFSVANSQSLKIEETKDIDLFNEVIENLDHDIAQEFVKINSTALGISFYADKIKLKQVIQNLLSNSIKFKHKDRDLTVQLTSYEDTQNVYLSVSDNGIGINAEYADKIFERFAQLNSKDKFEGTGLGLSLCKKNIEKHDGKIWLDPEYNNGAKFVISISKYLKQSA